MKRLLLFSIVGLTLFASCKKDDVEVFDLPKSISIAEGETINMLVGETVDLHLNCVPEDAWSPTREWTSSSPEIASVGIIGGTVTALNAGEAIITATINDGTSASCRVVVRAIPSTGIKIDKKDYEIVVGDVLKLNPKVLPDSASFKSVRYTSTDETVAIVGEDGIEGVGVGECKIIITNHDGITAECNLKVSHIRMNNGSLKIGPGQTFKFEIEPTIAVDRWISTDESVATIVDGTLTAVNAGHCAIVALAKSGKEIAYCNIEVTTGN
ncbi:MAG: Ig-like domain-containing protein [Salinivirgaceae bacterium]|nr:Ig-like domain-containing protein [Salinivirgaceae bacterium]